MEPRDGAEMSSIESLAVQECFLLKLFGGGDEPGPEAVTSRSGPSASPHPNTSKQRAA